MIRSSIAINSEAIRFDDPVSEGLAIEYQTSVLDGEPDLDIEGVVDRLRQTLIRIDREEHPEKYDIENEVVEIAASEMMEASDIARSQGMLSDDDDLEEAA